MADSGSPLTPEKRLLNLIESGGKAGAAEPVSSSSAPRTASAPRPAVVGLGGQSAGVDAHSLLASLSENVRLWTAGLKQKLGLRTVNQIARLILVLFILGAGLNAAYEHYAAIRNPLEGLDAPLHSAQMIELKDREQASKAIDLTETRNVFVPFEKRENVRPIEVKSSTGRLLEMTKSLRLTGISYNPDDEKANYCMIEDLAKNITVFLRVGDRISGMRVSQIRDESIELEYDNEKLDIR